MAPLASKSLTSSQQIICTSCGKASEAGKRAMSIFCPHCHKRVITEDLKVKSYHAVREFSTSGSISVERNGFVVARVKAGSLSVKGKVQGHTSSRGTITIKKNGWLKGDVEASSVVVEDGGILIGYVRIGPVDGDSE